MRLKRDQSLCCSLPFDIWACWMILGPIKTKLSFKINAKCCCWLALIVKEGIWRLDQWKDWIEGLLHHHLRIKALCANLLLQPFLFFRNRFLYGLPICATIIETLNNIPEPTYSLSESIFLNLCQLLHSDVKFKSLTRIQLKYPAAICHHLLFFTFLNPFCRYPDVIYHLTLIQEPRRILSWFLLLLAQGLNGEFSDIYHEKFILWGVSQDTIGRILRRGNKISD